MTDLDGYERAHNDAVKREQQEHFAQEKAAFMMKVRKAQLRETPDSALPECSRASHYS